MVDQGRQDWRYNVGGINDVITSRSFKKPAPPSTIDVAVSRRRKSFRRCETVRVCEIATGTFSDNMSANILVSNGTCYSAAGDKLDDSFIPCGNAAFGPQTCCGAGDICLKNNACFGYHGEGYGSQLTYQAGCTDPEYKDQSCPNKQGIGKLKHDRIYGDEPLITDLFSKTNHGLH